MPLEPGGALEAGTEHSLYGKQAWTSTPYFFDELLTLEQNEHKQRSEELRSKMSRRPHRKRLDEFDFSFQPIINKRQIDERATLAFAARTENAQNRIAQTFILITLLSNPLFVKYSCN